MRIRTMMVASSIAWQQYRHGYQSLRGPGVESDGMSGGDDAGANTLRDPIAGRARHPEFCQWCSQRHVPGLAGEDGEDRRAFRAQLA